VGGGEEDSAYGYYATVSGGWKNTAYGSCTVGGGVNNWAGGAAATVGGGKENKASGEYSTVSGGFYNAARGTLSVVCGGTENSATGDHAAVCGGGQPGLGNIAAGDGSFIGGGVDNRAAGVYSTVSGGQGNSAYDDNSTVCGGYGNDVNGIASTALGGYDNDIVASHALVGGSLAKASYGGAVVISATTSTTPADSAAAGGTAQMVLRADGCLYITDSATSGQAPYDATRLINTSSGGYLSQAGDWVDNSDRDRKENFTNVDGRALLDKLSFLSVTRWNYKVDGPGYDHIGPVAQDFHAAFGLGYDNKSIAARDLAGVALVANQELYRIVQDQETEIGQLKEQLRELEELVQGLIEDR
jgi:hypothetical protein